VKMKTPPEYGEIGREEHKTPHLQIPQARSVPCTNVGRNNERGQQRDRHVRVRELFFLEVRQEYSVAGYARHHVKANDQQVIEEQRKAARELARTEIE